MSITRLSLEDGQINSPNLKLVLSDRIFIKKIIEVFRNETKAKDHSYHLRKGRASCKTFFLIAETVRQDVLTVVESKFGALWTINKEGDYMICVTLKGPCLQFVKLSIYWEESRTEDPIWSQP